MGDRFPKVAPLEPSKHLKTMRGIESEGYIHRPLGTALTLCIITLNGGFAVVGQSGTLTPDLYDKELGERWARKDALDKIEVLAAFEHLEPAPTASPDKTFSDDVQQDVCVAQKVSVGECAGTAQNSVGGPSPVEMARLARDSALYTAARIYERTGMDIDTVLSTAEAIRKYLK